MAFASAIALVAFLLLLPLSATNDVCKEVQCGKGTCKPSKNSTFPFDCECDQGWKQALASNDHKGWKFLPCIIPNCTLNYSCSSAPSSAPEKARKVKSIFDACHWVDCRGGSCNKTSSFSYSCECDAGYDNLLNATALPCYKECALGMGCSDLGISVKNTSSSAPPALNEDSKNEASSILQGSSLWMVLLITFMAELQLQ